MGANAVVIGLCALSLGATCWLVASTPRDSDERVEALERKLAAAERRADAVEALRAELRTIESKLDRGIGGARREAAAAEPGAPATAEDGSPADSAAAAGAPAKPLDELVADRVEQKLTERLDVLAARSRERGNDGKWKAPLDALARELSLSESQTADAKRVFDRARDEAFVLLRTPRADGGSLLDDYVAALKSGADAGETTRRLFQRLYTDKVPGTDSTFLAQITALGADVEEQLSRRLDAAQMKRLKALNVDLLDVKSGYDPVGDYVRARLQ